MPVSNLGFCHIDEKYTCTVSQEDNCVSISVNKSQNLTTVQYFRSFHKLLTNTSQQKSSIPLVGGINDFSYAIIQRNPLLSVAFSNVFQLMKFSYREKERTSSLCYTTCVGDFLEICDTDLSKS